MNDEPQTTNQKPQTTNHEPHTTDLKPQTLFAVIRTQGPAWDNRKPLRSQSQWTEHAGFMNALAAKGFIVLGGPLGEGPDVLLIVNALNQANIVSTLAEDPWSPNGMLEIKSIQQWTVLLDSTQTHA
jgi:hypothetical protein